MLALVPDWVVRLISEWVWMIRYSWRLDAPGCTHSRALSIHVTQEAGQLICYGTRLETMEKLENL